MVISHRTNLYTILPIIPFHSSTPLYLLHRHHIYDINDVFNGEFYTCMSTSREIDVTRLNLHASSTWAECQKNWRRMLAMEDADGRSRQTLDVKMTEPPGLPHTKVAKPGCCCCCCCCGAHIYRCVCLSLINSPKSTINAFNGRWFFPQLSRLSQAPGLKAKRQTNIESTCYYDTSGCKKDKSLITVCIYNSFKLQRALQAALITNISAIGSCTHLAAKPWG